MIAHIFAPAKINLHLDVLNKRPDGFHNLLSIFQSVSLGDFLTIRLTKRESFCQITGDFLFPPEDNIIKRAIDKFFGNKKKNVGLDIQVKKIIPIGAGLGGGSSDAAAIILCLEKLFPGYRGEEEVNRVLCALGSDVPFFYSAIAGLVSGRGEKIEKLLPRCDFWLVIVYPGFKISTVDAYRWLDKKKGETGKIGNVFLKSSLITMYMNESIAKWRFTNSFEAVIGKKYPELPRIIKDLRDNKALYASITGSGSALFGIFDDENVAQAATECLKKKYPKVFLAKPLDKKPEPVLQ